MIQRPLEAKEKPRSSLWKVATDFNIISDGSAGAVFSARPGPAAHPGLHSEPVHAYTQA